jgi:hypothetical protein
MRFIRLVLAAALAGGIACVQAAGVGSATAPEQGAQVAAVADGASTLMVLGAGGMEMNPMVPTSPLGILGITVMKVGLARHLDGLPPKEREFGLKCSTSIWGGAAVNNLLALTAASPPLALAAGLMAGVAFWRRTGMELEAQAQARAAQALEIQALFQEPDTADGVLVAGD